MKRFQVTNYAELSHQNNLDLVGDFEEASKAEEKVEQAAEKVDEVNVAVD
jgi:hypothetical protein